jgi:hypothetical protein
MSAQQKAAVESMVDHVARARESLWSAVLCAQQAEQKGMAVEYAHMHERLKVSEMMYRTSLEHASQPAVGL